MIYARKIYIGPIIKILPGEAASIKEMAPKEKVKLEMDI